MYDVIIAQQIKFTKKFNMSSGDSQVCTPFMAPLPLIKCLVGWFIFSCYTEASTYSCNLPFTLHCLSSCSVVTLLRGLFFSVSFLSDPIQGCISCSILVSGIRARGVSSEHMENLEMLFLFSNLGALWFSENLIRYSLHVCLREVKNNLFSFKHSYLRHFSWRFKKI